MKQITIKRIYQIITGRIDDFRREMRDHWREMIVAEAPAGTLAAAFATGTLISTIPVPLVDMALAAYVMRRYSSMPRGPFFSGMALANNLVMAPLYAATPRVGGLALSWLSDNTAVQAPEAFLARVFVGYLFIALGLALGSYVLANTGFRGYQAARQRRMDPS